VKLEGRRGSSTDLDSARSEYGSLVLKLRDPGEGWAERELGF